ncbi:hypothetical protein ABZX98_16920 [Streptomyces sp. NPDC002992]|uniref:hypothetical protein n=1 Tax=Streptomyces sp. NPDC002992 TaxID=3154273 RepID=UPI0033B6063E
MAKIHTKTAVATGTAALAMTLVAGMSGTAHAGGNGQQILFHDRLTTVYSVSIAGNNQAGQYVEHCFNTPSTDNYLGGWWWTGHVSMEGFSGSGCGGQRIFTSPAAGPVPTYQANSDWYRISD